jgi:uncharacterized protein (TIGR00730 family)
MMKSRDLVVLQRCVELVIIVEDTTEREIEGELMQTIVLLSADDPGRGEMRLMLRAFKELRYAFKTFKTYRHRRKVSMFGSARTQPDHPDYLLAEKMARLSAEAGFMVITGAGPGIMQAGNVGAGQAHSFGVAIKLPFEQGTNDAIAGNDKLIHFRYFFSRKLVFVKETHAIALFPGGFGTHDEGFEVLTLVQTGRADPLPIVMIEHEGGSYWREWDRFVRKELLGNGMISPEDLSLYHITHDAGEAVDHIRRFYSNYQSLRYVRDELILRVKHAPTAGELDGLNADFSDIVREGKIAVGTTARWEPDSPFPEAPCVSMNFNRRSLARLRQVIDRLNALPSLPPIVEAAPAAAEVGANHGDRNVAEIAEEEGIKIVGPEA